MIFSKKLFFIFFLFYSFNLYSTEISVINIEKIINNNISFKEILKNIEISKTLHLENFKKIQNKLDSSFSEIENSKNILNDKELNKMIDNYNYELNSLNLSIEKYNLHFQKEIALIKNQILSEIIVLVEKYAINKNIDLILDSTSYIIASNAIDITEEIENELKEKKLKLEFTDFEKN